MTNISDSNTRKALYIVILTAATCGKYSLKSENVLVHIFDNQAFKFQMLLIAISKFQPHINRFPDNCMSTNNVTTYIRNVLTCTKLAVLALSKSA